MVYEFRSLRPFLEPLHASETNILATFRHQLANFKNVTFLVLSMLFNV